ncbi:MAG: hypothetical protein AB1598_03925 [Thermodesulfobacteriota bacterium]
MKKNIIIVSIVLTAVSFTLWLKPSSSTNSGSNVLEPDKAHADNKILLFADPREADSSCGCAEVISVARSAAGVPGVAYAEFDINNSREEARKYSVRISPTVIFLNKDNTEKARFEGESSSVIKELRGTVGSLKNEIEQE